MSPNISCQLICCRYLEVGRRTQLLISTESSPAPTAGGRSVGVAVEGELSKTAVFRNALAGIFGRFSLFYNYLWFCKSISSLTPMTSHPRFFDLQGIPGHLSPLQHFCNHFQFWNSTSSLSLRTENAAPTMLSH